ncbi:divergent polysaccharide deacetylase family protein [Planctobacterium marinum]|uniref:divergent polysaccharide deacetylase family protein n=1 Tax=Planctobacterium marinum TaxID=1631968 RepID=UPI001E2D97CD|nr:divergent polysaccharide deacetylase family protein [Planctobacterium marinum]MCC2607811.1 divergent polysaccharide deacetylase family protein [Planctobacterium marinum]
MPVWFLLALLAQPQSLHAAEIALIIDDMGNSDTDGVAFNLPEQVAFAILPHTPHSKKFALTAAGEQRDVLVHMPMEALSGLNMGPGGISSEMSESLIRQRLTEAFESVPQAIGFNNHMGSKLTQLTAPMQTTMEFLNFRHLFFLDSRTTRYSKAEHIAKDFGVPTVRRHVFLDHVQETQHIDYQFRRLLRKAKRDGFAVGIAHPHKVTLEYLQAALQALDEEGIRLISLRDKLPQTPKQWAWNQNSQYSR